MANFDLMQRLTKAEGGKILLLVMDGLGGLPPEPGGPTALEAAPTPNMDKLAAAGVLGRTVPIVRGVTPGSGPAHLALFGYDPLLYDVGRGVLAALGAGLDVGPGDVCARGNFCTVDEEGVITDRRAGRIPTEKGAELVAKLQTIALPGVKTEVAGDKEYRFVLKLTGAGLSAAIADTDPQAVGKKPLAAVATAPEAEHTAALVNEWLAAAADLLKDERPANMVTMRGFAMDPRLPQYREVYKLKAACVAVYPMYKGVSKAVGMDIIESDPHDSAADEFERVAAIWEDYDFVFCHIKYTDSRGEDGDFAAKVKVIEEVDRALPALTALQPDVFIITGDHSTPARLKSHRWHPVPTLLWTAGGVHLPDRTTAFGERECMAGGLGVFPATALMPLALGHALRLKKYGA